MCYYIHMNKDVIALHVMRSHLLNVMFIVASCKGKPNDRTRDQIATLIALTDSLVDALAERDVNHPAIKYAVDALTIINADLNNENSSETDKFLSSVFKQYTPSLGPKTADVAWDENIQNRFNS